MNCRVMHVFYDVHMGAAHAGLSLMLADKKKSPLSKGEVAVFLNRAWTAAKLLTAEGYLLYWRSPGGHPITAEELRYLPAAFGGTKMQFSGNLEAKIVTLQNQREAALAKRLKAVLTA